MTSAPLRLQRRRARGYSMQNESRDANGLYAVSVTRPGKWGNPFYPGSGMSMGFYDGDMRMVNPEPTPANCVAWFAKRLETMPGLAAAARAELQGMNLACYCALCAKHSGGKPFNVRCADCAPCHSDPLGMTANSLECVEIK